MNILQFLGPAMHSSSKMGKDWRMRYDFCIRKIYLCMCESHSLHHSVLHTVWADVKQTLLSGFSPIRDQSLKKKWAHFHDLRVCPGEVHCFLILNNLLSSPISPTAQPCVPRTLSVVPTNCTKKQLSQQTVPKIKFRNFIPLQTKGNEELSLPFV